MGKFSTYRYLELKDSSSSGPVSSRGISLKRPRRLKRVFILLIVVAVCGTYLMDYLVDGQLLRLLPIHGHVSKEVWPRKASEHYTMHCTNNI
ncbi:hypothetical protein RR46_00889 [Papilio xuthus]|uniref:Uncharacterized protein n=1 Tax=Papilio xuthus TaxID=66420 RepID=A0A0N1I4N8_PAPXU|nr:hypothetical protein RR46_00889 [Papilio xuthus]